MSKNSEPGIEREQRISDDGLSRLESHLQRGTKISAMVLKQWIRRYGEDARELIQKYGQYSDDLQD